MTATVTSGTPSVGVLQTSQSSGASVTVDIVPGQLASPPSLAAGGVEFDPLTIGSSDITAVLPQAFLSTSNATQTVSVSAPGISVSAATVGSGLQSGTFRATLGASQHGGVTVTLTSSNPSVMLVSPDGSTEGQPSIDVFVPNGQNRASYWIQGVEGATGTVTLTVQAPGFTDGSAAVSVVQPGIQLVSLNGSYTASAQDDLFQIQTGVPNSNNTGLSIVRP